MYKEILSAVNGMTLFPLISLFIFVSVFSLVLYRVFRSDKSWADAMAHLPLENDSDKINDL